MLAALSALVHIGFFIIFLGFLFFLIKRKGSTLSQILLVVLIFLSFFIKTVIEDSHNLTKLSGEQQDFTFLLLQPLTIDGNLFQSQARDMITGEKVIFQYKIKSEQEKEKLKQLQIGAKCKVKGTLEQPNQAGNPGSFDYRKYLRHQNIFWIFNSNFLQSCTEYSSPLIAIQKIRQNGVSYLHSHFPAETAALAAALIFGEREYINPDLNEAYQRLGIVHLLAISGLHVGMLTGILYYIGLRMNVTHEKMTTSLIIFLPVYAILTGSSPSVIRACLMLELLLVVKKLKIGQTVPPIDTISFVAFTYLLFQPYVIYNIGFQLSFSVTFSLILAAPLLKKYTVNQFNLLLVTSMIAQLASMPILLYHFYEFSLVSFLINIVYVPLFSSIVLPVILLLFILHLLMGNMVFPLLSLFDFYLMTLNKVTKGISLFPYSTLTVGRPSSVVIFLYLIGIPYFFYKWGGTKNRQSFLLLLLIPLGMLFVQYSSQKLHPYGEVTMIDVGQGDSILITLPLNRGTYLIDTGGALSFERAEWTERRDPFEVGADVIVPYLKSRGITKVDKLILTHGDADHAGGAISLLNSIKVNEVVLPKIAEASSIEKDIIRTAGEKKIPIHYGSRGRQWKADGIRFRILSPALDTNLERNDASIVLYAELGGLQWLFTGDIEERGEEELMAAYRNLRVDVLKVAHHGSKTSTTEKLLQTYKPKIALISVGKNNRFGHPHEEVIERLGEHNVKIYRTDLNGAISFRFRGGRGTFFANHHTMY